MSKSKIAPSHSTAVEAAQNLSDQLTLSEEILKVSFGVIEQCKTIRGNRRIKINSETGCYLVKVRDISCVQQLRVYSSNEKALDIIKQAAIKLGYDIQGD